jgi:ferrous iron transport protein B
MKKLYVALTGNPNVGKSTLFNQLTGGDQHVGNWPGKTVALKHGHFNVDDTQIEIIDLPGTYSFSAYSPEEEITHDFLVKTPPDMVINVVDTSNFERNLYLTVQILETGIPTILLLNMQDVAAAHGIQIDTEKLSAQLGGIPVLISSASNGGGWDKLKKQIVAPYPDIKQIDLQYEEEIEENAEYEFDLEAASSRYDFISKISKTSLKQEKHKVAFSEKVDSILTNRYLGIPIFLVIMYFVFNLVQNVSAPFLNWLDYLFTGPFSNWATSLLASANAPAWVTSLVVDGVINSIGGVLVFLPSLYIMFLLLAVLEHSGYLARAAYVMDKLMSKIGLHGKSFIPMILGFGCNVPAIYATRTLKNPKARILTALLIPFMSCSARLPVYLIFSMAFFPENSNLIILLMYLTGIMVAGLVGTALSRLIFKGESLSILVMELPNFRKPSLKAILKYAGNQSGNFIKKAGTIIAVASIGLWMLLNLPFGIENPRDSYFGAVSVAISPIMEPAGFGNWEASGALLTGLVAKEAVISTFNQVYRIDEVQDTSNETAFIEDIQNIVISFGTSVVDAGKELLNTFTPGIDLFVEDSDSGIEKNIFLISALNQNFTPLSAFSYLIFILLYIPCVPTIAAFRHEFGWKWTSLAIFNSLAIPWVLSVGVFQIGKLLGFG